MAVLPCAPRDGWWDEDDVGLTWRVESGYAAAHHAITGQPTGVVRTVASFKDDHLQVSWSGPL